MTRPSPSAEFRTVQPETNYRFRDLRCAFLDAFADVEIEICRIIADQDPTKLNGGPLGEKIKQLAGLKPNCRLSKQRIGEFKALEEDSRDLLKVRACVVHGKMEITDTGDGIVALFRNPIDMARRTVWSCILSEDNFRRQIDEVRALASRLRPDA